MRTRMYGGVRGRKTKIGGKPTFVFLLLDLVPGAGIEPARIAPLVFETSASTDSAIRAFARLGGPKAAFCSL